MAVPHNALAAILGLEISMLGERIRDLRLDRLRQQRASSLPQDFGELVVKGSWLNQFEYAIVGHGISLLQWRSGVVKQPHECRLFDSCRHQLSAIAQRTLACCLAPLVLFLDFFRVLSLALLIVIKSLEDEMRLIRRQEVKKPHRRGQIDFSLDRNGRSR